MREIPGEISDSMNVLNGIVDRIRPVIDEQIALLNIQDPQEKAQLVAQILNVSFGDQLSQEEIYYIFKLVA